MIVDQIRDLGFALSPSVVDSTALPRLIAATDVAVQHPSVRARQGSAYGLRNLLEIMPAAREFAESPAMMTIVRSVLGRQARVVKGILFDKTAQANWAVPWHQDVTIAVKRKCVLPGYEAWSEKEGLPHVQPPVEVLENMLAARVHLDPCPAENGALKVILGSHAHGRLSDQAAAHWRKTVAAQTCSAAAGDVLFMRPLLLHSSAASIAPAHRRVLHFEYAAFDLPAGLDWNE